jgi:hypothetical protein
MAIDTHIQLSSPIYPPKSLRRIETMPPTQIANKKRLVA